MNKAPENSNQQAHDSDMIFTQISTAGYETWHEAQRAVVMLFVMDPTVSRSGIAHALKRLKQHYSTKHPLSRASHGSSEMTEEQRLRMESEFGEGVR